MHWRAPVLLGKFQDILEPGDGALLSDCAGCMLLGLPIRFKCSRVQSFSCAHGTVQLDTRTKLVQVGAMSNAQRPTRDRKRFTVALDLADYEALQTLGAEQRPPLKQQYLVELAVKNLLDQHSKRQISLPLERSNA